MLEAQEMFRTANRVTRPEKALILGFMAGSRGMLIDKIMFSICSPNIFIIYYIPFIRESLYSSFVHII